MKTFIQLFKFPLLGGAGFVVTPYIPEPELLEILKYLLLGGITGNLCSMIFKLCEWAKGDTKKLLSSVSLTGREQTRLAQTFRRRSSLLWQYNILVCVFMGIGWFLYVFHSKGYWKLYSIRLSMGFVFMTVPLFITVLQAWRDYVVTKEKLERRDAGVSDVD
mgnify:CR=1 FL=1